MAKRKSPKAWSGRFQKAADPALERFSSSVHFDQALWRQDLRGSLAHARMLAQQGILSDEDIHMNVERRLYELAGAVAGKLHSGRSRNDQIATDFLLWLRDAIPELRQSLLGLRGVLVERAAAEIDVVLPGYTHLQRAQPVRLAHHWLAHEQALARDDGRLADARARMRGSPLGAGALAGSTLPLDREHTARALGFEGPAANSLDAVSARDAALELLAGLAIAMVHLSRLCEELVLWSSTEFGFVEFDDAFATGSSLMPQKKNPDVAELVRGKTGRVVGDLISLLVTMKGLPLSYNRDMQEDKEPVFDAVSTTRDCLDVLAAALRSLRVNREAMAAAAADPLLLATDLAEHLVSAGIPFREAHEVVGRVVAHSGESGTPLSGLSRETLLGFHPALDVEPATFFSAERSLEARSAVGGPARKTVERAVEQARTTLSACQAELERASE
jgi:argininosuccinate lyase